jgi:hypothetical protein
VSAHAERLTPLLESDHAAYLRQMRAEQERDPRPLRTTARGCRWRRNDNGTETCLTCGSVDMAFDPDDYPLQ